MTSKHSNTRSEANYIIESLQEFVLEELENGRGEVVSRARVGYSDAQFAECCFEQSVEPGKYTIFLANRASKKGSDYKLCRHCRAVEVCEDEPAK